MRRRHSYLLLFVVPAALCAAMAAVLVVGAAAGAMWIFVYGDNPWPAAAEVTLASLAGLAFVATFSALLSIAYRVGRAQEERANFNYAHWRLALGSCALLVLIAVGYQWKVGNVGPRSEGEVCADFCTLRGFNGSSMPPRNSGLSTCICVDGKGRGAVTASILEAAAALKAAGR
jgi:hypothetical protein